MAELGILKDMPESNQLSLFDLYKISALYTRNNEIGYQERLFFWGGKFASEQTGDLTFYQTMIKYSSTPQGYKKKKESNRWNNIQ